MTTSAVIRGLTGAMRASTISPMPSVARDYAHIHSLVAIVQWRDGRIGVSKDPFGAATALWCDETKTGEIVRKAKAGMDIAEAARQLGVETIDHGRLLMRARWQARSRLFNPARPR